MIYDDSVLFHGSDVVGLVFFHLECNVQVILSVS